VPTGSRSEKMTLRKEALHMHRLNKCKLETVSKFLVRNSENLSLAYSPGVAEPCKEIHDKPERVYDYTMKGNTGTKTAALLLPERVSELYG
jgi:malate dehydrogenase (oxaloacetate-decarboxylating)